MNSVALVGNLARDPDYRATPNGIGCCQFTVACQRKYKDADGKYLADFISCIAWRQTAEFVHKYFTKGSRIGLTGTIQTRSYDGQDGQKKFVTEVIAENVDFVGPRQDNGSQAAGGAAAGSTAPAQNSQPAKQVNMEDFTEVDDELPF